MFKYENSKSGWTFMMNSFLTKNKIAKSFKPSYKFIPSYQQSQNKVNEPTPKPLLNVSSPDIQQYIIPPLPQLPSFGINFNVNSSSNTNSAPSMPLLKKQYVCI